MVNIGLQDPEEQQKLVAKLHKLKTDIFMDMVEGGSMPLRPGVARLVSAPTPLAQPPSSADPNPGTGVQSL